MSLTVFLLLILASSEISPYVFSVEEDSTEESIDIFCFIRGTVIGHWWLRDTIEDCNPNSTLRDVPMYNCTVTGNRNMKSDVENTRCLTTGTFFDYTWLCANRFFRKPNYGRCADKQFRCYGVVLRCNTYTWTFTTLSWIMISATAGFVILIATVAIVIYASSYYAHSQSFNVRRHAIEIQKQMRLRGDGLEGFSQL